MKFSSILSASFATYAFVSATPMAKHAQQAAAAGSGTASTAAMEKVGAAAAAVSSGSTIVMKEVGGIAGNECLTFRNNGKQSSSLSLDNHLTNN